MISSTDDFNKQRRDMNKNEIISILTNLESEFFD